jgi:hypothetical protein
VTFTDAWPGVPTAGVDVTGRGESKHQWTAVAPDASIVADALVCRDRARDPKRSLAPSMTFAVRERAHGRVVAAVGGT